MTLLSAEVVPELGSEMSIGDLQRVFEGLGFQVHAYGTGTFSIAAVEETFRACFKLAGPSGDELPAELPVSALPPTIRSFVRQVVFTRGYVPFAS